MPSTAAYVARALGFKGAAMDLNAACSGFVYGLVTAGSMLTAGGGRGAVVIGADVLTPWMDPGDRGTLPLFGDGAAAVVLRPGAGASGPGLLAWDLGVDGEGADLLQVPGGGSCLPLTPAVLATGAQYLKMEGREVFRRAVRSVEASCSTLLASAGVSPDEVALFVPHQANTRIVDAILPRLGIKPDRTMINIDRYGNTSAASIPIALSEAAAEGRVADGDLVLLAGFGAGMTWASALMRWGYTGTGPAPTLSVP
jgi:3-oxoacyl-[acyl-carrier-protein] synthase-3